MSTAKCPCATCPKVWATVVTGIFGEVPDPKTLFTKGHISAWVVDMHSAELAGDGDEKRSMRSLPSGLSSLLGGVIMAALEARDLLGERDRLDMRTLQ